MRSQVSWLSGSSDFFLRVVLRFLAVVFAVPSDEALVLRFVVVFDFDSLFALVVFVFDSLFVLVVFDVDLALDLD